MGIELLEEAVALVRQAPARAWTWYLAGAIPFFAALLFYIRATTGALAVPDPAAAALALALLFGWRQFTRSVFGRLLTEQLSGVPHLPRLWLRAAVRTWFAGMLRVLFFWLPAPWLSALFRNYQAYAWDEEHALRQTAAMAARGGNPLVSWLTLWAVSFFVWLNILMGMAAGPMLYKIFTGEEAALTRNAAAMLNRTVFAASLATAWCLADVLMEAMYVLRRYYGESERSGADLVRAWRRTLTSVGISILMAAGLHAQTPPPVPSETQLNHAIDDVLSQQQYQWREAPPQTASDSAFVKWTRSLVDSVQRGFKAITRPIRRLWNAFMRWLRGSLESKGQPDGPRAPVDALRLAAVLVSIVLAGVLIALLLGSRSRRAVRAAEVPPAGPLPVDLSDPGISAADLAEEQWLALAREWMSKGDSRMALRAWFLACLAWLGRRELVSIGRHKSNLDYRRELAWRARGIAGLDQEFAARVRTFESAWYGSSPLDASAVDNFAEGFERMRRLAG
jgi:hypothetical protein